jgi:Flp pilus assembly pilin Flp
MNPISRKGQTALEYLLIVVVAIIVVVAVMVWMNATTSTTVGTASGNVNEALCRSISCYDVDDCAADECGGPDGSATCEGTSSVGGTPIPGFCQPA